MITDIEREIRLNDRIIRHMVIALEEQVTILPPPTPEELAANAAAAEGADGVAPDSDADGARTTDGDVAESEVASEASTDAVDAEATLRAMWPMKSALRTKRRR